jgi:hypothetical protein
MSGDAIGMMEGAFFVSKGVILDWMNELLDVSFNFLLISNNYCSYNYQKSSSAQQDQFIARLWMPFTQELSVSQK